MPVEADQWYLVTDYKDIYYFINTDSVWAGSSYTTFSVMSVNKKSHKVDVIKKCTINCVTKTMAVRKVVRRGFFGEREENSFEDGLRWYDIPPNSAAESMERLVCSGSKPRERLKEYCMDPYSQSMVKPWTHLFDTTR